MKSTIRNLSLLLVGVTMVVNLNAQSGARQNRSLYTYTPEGRISGYAFPQLPYAYEALQPAIDSLTMSIHYDKHHRAYYTKFTAAAKENGLEGKSLEEIFASVSKYPEGIRNNGGGYYNHFLYWENMAPVGSTKPTGDAVNAIIKQFGSLDKFKEQFGNAAKGKFGSGWAWLILDANNELQITTTSNQDNPLMDITEKKGRILLALDVWEHAYYLKYQNKRGDYVDAFWSVVNWDEVNRRYKTALRSNAPSTGLNTIPGINSAFIQQWNSRYITQLVPGC